LKDFFFVPKKKELGHYWNQIFKHNLNETQTQFT